MKIRYQYRIYPTAQQQTELAKLFGCARVVWNDALAIIKNTPRGERWPSWGDIEKTCTTQAKRTPERVWLAEVSNIPLQQSIRDLKTAFKNFFEGLQGKRPRMGFPRFKRKSNEQSARFTRGGFSLKGNRVYLAKIGKVKVRWSRPLPSVPSSATVIKDRAGRYFLSFVVEVEPINVAPKNQGVGIDLGLKTFASLSDGRTFKAPDTTDLDRQIRKGKRKFARALKGSKRRERLRVAIARMEARQADIRADFQSKLASGVVHESSVVVLEDLRVSNMVKNRRLARAISRAGWRTFRQRCEAKATMIEGRDVRAIDRWEPTSQVCSCCGYRWGKLDLSVRSVVCINCGTEHDRDINAAINIKAAGHVVLNGQALSNVRPPSGAVACLPSHQTSA